MAVDANVLIFERFKEEIRNGKTLRSAMDAGFNRAFVTIFDSNVTTLMAAVILFYLGTGPIKGFAVTLAIGVILSMFSAITVTKFLLRFLISSNFTKNPAFFGVKNYKIFFSITIIFLLIGFGSIVTRGFNLGIDFTGGSIVDLTFENPVNVAQVRDVLKEHDMGNSIIQLENSDGKTEANSVLIRTGVVEDTELRATMNDLQSKLGNYQIQRVEQVGATIGSELVQQAAMAIVLSWVLMIAYITFRFEFKFAIAAIIALIIDVLVVLSYFSLFQMEMDSSFVAALLTVVGYSVNGTIVIFDRIRENLKIHRRSESLGEMVDNSIWQCMTRTIYTVATSLFAIVSIFLFGGETIHNFSFAMLVGFASGAYTSIFLAGPMWMFLKNKKIGI